MTLRKRYARELSAWGIPALYGVVAIAAGMTFPRIESHIFPGLVSGATVPVAMAIYSAIASGMLALTGIVFSLTFVMVQFSATAYSPRLVLWVVRDPLMAHALGVFIATFVYAIAALAGLDRSPSGKAPFISTWVVVALLLASVGMFIGLIERVGLLQVNRMLIFTGDQGRRVITTMYPSINPETATRESDDFHAFPRTYTLVYHGRPRSVQAVDAVYLANLAKTSAGVIEVVVTVGDTVVELTPLLHIFGGRVAVDEGHLRKGIELGGERTFEQDPKYAIRLLVDIAIRALSPAVNDPTTAVQSLDQIEDLLLRLGQRKLEIGSFRDNDGKLRLVVPVPSWDDLVLLAFDEICFYGASSVQVMRRMNALISDLIQALPEERGPALVRWRGRLQATIASSFADNETRLQASIEDRQGLGAPRQHSSENGSRPIKTENARGPVAN